MADDTSRYVTLVALAPMLMACGDGGGEGPIAPTYENVDALIRRSCTFAETCHGGPGAGRARLDFQPAIDRAGRSRWLS